ncbi:MAG: hypothetical protein FD132_2611 [bacterium]|nr:MAG: hypothetical protein FD132_2611 [bacterium]
MTQPAPETPLPNWHALDAAVACAHHATDPAGGLTAEAARERLSRFGENRLPESRRAPSGSPSSTSSGAC